MLLQGQTRPLRFSPFREPWLRLVRPEVGTQWGLAKKDQQCENPFPNLAKLLILRRYNNRVDHAH